MQQPPNAGSAQSDGSNADPMGSGNPNGPSGPLPTSSETPGTQVQATGSLGATGATSGTPLWSPPHAPTGPGSGPNDATTAFSTAASASSAGDAAPPPPSPPIGSAYAAGSAGTGKRLYRKTHDKLFLGVCSGLAEYFDIDKTLMRIIFVCGSLLIGTGLILYLVLALVMPAEEALDLDPRVAAQQTVDEAVNEVKRGAEYVTAKARDLTGRNKPQA